MYGWLIELFDSFKLNRIWFRFGIENPDSLLMPYYIIKWHDFFCIIIFDEFYLVEMKAGNKWWANKYGAQFGVKSYDCLGIKNLGFQSEFNLVRPFTYSHQTSLINYGHNNQSLAHPVGANYYELSNFMRYKKGKWYFEEQFNYLVYGQDASSNNYGGDI